MIHRSEFYQRLTQTLFLQYLLGNTVLLVFYVALPQLGSDMERHAASDSAHLQEEPASR